MISLKQLLKTMIEQKASDLHLVEGSNPVLRVEGEIVRVKSEPLKAVDCERLCYSILTEEQKNQLEENREIDLSFGIKDLARFRVNLFFQKGNVSGVFRLVPFKVPEIDSLGIPQSVAQLTDLRSGLVLVTGPTGCGKSTTIATLIDKINQEKTGHIVTLENPIEYLHDHNQCIVNQREIDNDTRGFKDALRSVLRQDPDYVMLGELRDLITTESALTVAETGHLVFSTLHTNSAVDTINRIVNIFPGSQQDRIRFLLSFVLKAVVSQRLVPSLTGERIPILEVLLVNSAVANLIRENKVHQIYGMMNVGQDKTGMITFNQSLVKAILRRKIDLKVAFSWSPDPEELDSLLKKAGV